jgi:hypothetical protein
MKRIFSLGLVLFLAACGADLPPPAAVVSVSQPSASLDRSIWSTQDSGTFVHIQSGIQFPEKLGTYQRVRTHEYDPQGADVSVAYQDTASDATSPVPEITFYVTNKSRFNIPDITAQEYVDDAARAIFDRWKSAKLVQSGTYTSDVSDLASGPYHLLKVKLGKTMYRSGAWASKRGDWFLKARFTYVEGEDPLAALMQKTMSSMNKSAGGKSLSFTMTDSKGLALDMGFVADMIDGVGWQGD